LGDDDKEEILFLDLIHKVRDEKDYQKSFSQRREAKKRRVEREVIKDNLPILTNKEYRIYPSME